MLAAMFAGNFVFNITKKKFFRLFIAVLSFYLMGCAQWALKERCEKTNWFEYSRDVAFSGKFLEEDEFIKDCKGVDRTNSQQLDIGFKLGREKMCSYDEIFLRGKTGVPVFFKFCDGLEPRTMKAKHEEGLRIFCRKDNGYTYGKTGLIYQNLCRYRGRKEYLLKMKSESESRLSRLQADLQNNLDREKTASGELAAVPNVLSCAQINVFDEAQKVEVERTVCAEPEHIKDRRNSLVAQLRGIRGQISQIRDDAAQTQAQLAVFVIELEKIPR
jgi:hypothetical protein